MYAAVTAATLVLGASPARAGMGGYEGVSFGGPITTWLARAPASCVLDPSFRGGRFPNSDHVAYWVGHAMDGDETALEKHLRRPATWHESIAGGTEAVKAVYDPLLHVAAYNIGHQDLDEWGLLADVPEPPPHAAPMRADLSMLTLGGNVHLGDSLATVTSAIGLRALTPTNIAAACPGFGVVELCDWNVPRCACPPRMFYQGSHDISGTIIFRNGRVVGLFWNAKCWAAG